MNKKETILNDIEGYETKYLCDDKRGIISVLKCGDILLEQNLWTPTFVCTACGTQTQKLRIFLKHVLHHLNVEHRAVNQIVNKIIDYDDNEEVKKFDKIKEIKTFKNAQDVKKSESESLEWVKKKRKTTMKAENENTAFGQISSSEMIKNEEIEAYAEMDFDNNVPEKSLIEEVIIEHTDSEFLEGFLAEESLNSEYTCKYCTSSFRSKHGLENHIRRHLGIKSYKCKYCGKSFTTASEQKSHLLTHTGQRPYLCKICGRTFTYRSSLSAHRRYGCYKSDETSLIHEDSLQDMSTAKATAHVDLSAKLPVATKTNKRTSTEENEELPSCNERLPLSIMQTRRAKTNHKLLEETTLLSPIESYTSLEQNPEPSNYTQTDREESESHTEENCIENNSYVADDVSFDESSVKTFSSVQQSVVGDKLGMEASESNSADIYTDNSEDEFECDDPPEINSIVENIKEDYTESISNVQEEIVTDQTAADDRTCSKCLKTFEFSCYLKRHKCSKTKEKPKMVPKSITCEVCLKSFRFPSIMKRHICIDTKKETIACEYCGSTFRDRRNLTVHINRHLGIKKHKCTLCEKSFASTTELKCHMVRHTGEHPYKCSECGRTFQYYSTLYEHRKRHANNRPHGCETCGKRFFDKGALREHMVTHTGETPYACSVCDMKFGRDETRKQHMKLHSAVKSYQCKFCDKAFAQYAGLYSHLKRHKQDQSESS